MGIFRFFKNAEGKDPRETAEGPSPESPESGKKTRRQPVAAASGGADADGPAGEDRDRTFHEKDNRGVRVMRFSQAEILWEEIESGPGNVSFAAFAFDTEFDASEALYSLSFMHEAADTANPVCSMEYVFGYYRRRDGKYEAVIAGESLSDEHWKETIRKFSTGGGTWGKEKKPGTKVASATFDKHRKVVFLKEYSRVGLTETRHLVEYEAPDAITARAFLNDPARRVEKKNQMILVRTPEGDLCRDYFGVRESRV